MSRRTAGPGSSPGLSTKQKTALWKKLRSLDRICAVHSPLRLGHIPFSMYATREKLFAKHDERRKQIRAVLKNSAI
jgi:hypothetical protein